ncbi:hypothetical protein Taro_036761, partial [Colocasia esculenta]|nr:hypothetical protein [Colocasia esculenta]
VQVWCSRSSSAHLSVCSSRRLREPTCGVAFTSAKLLSVEPSALLLELSRCSVLRCIAWLPCVLVRFPKTICCCPEWCLGGSGGGSPRTCL